MLNLREYSRGPGIGKKVQRNFFKHDVSFCEMFTWLFCTVERIGTS